MQETVQSILDELDIDVFESLFTNGFVVTDVEPRFHIIYASALFLKMLGYDSMEELVAMTGGDAISSVAKADLARVHVAGTTRGDQGTFSISYRIRCKDGSTRSILQTSRHKVLASGRTVIIAAYTDAEAPDASERSRLEEELTEANARAERADRVAHIVLENANLAVWEYHLTERCNVYTPETAVLLGLPTTVENVPESLIERGIVRADCADLLIQMYADVASGKPRAQGEIAIIKDGKTIWLDVIMTTRYENGRAVAAICTGQDITREKLLLLQMEDEVSRRTAYENTQSQAVLKAIVRNSYDAIVVVSALDASYRVLTHILEPTILLPAAGDDYWADLKRALREQTTPEELSAIEREGNQEHVIRTLETAPTCSFVVSLTGSNSAVRAMKVQYSYLDDTHQSLLMTSMDVTATLAAEKQQREMLSSALLAAQQANSAKSDFLSRMSHEIRTPLNTILGMVALAAQSKGNEEEVQDCISKIGISGHYLLSLINDILDMSRIESGKLLLHSAPFDFVEFLNSITSVIYAQASSKHINYECLVDHGIGDSYIGDEMKLTQVLINILGNAVKFTPEGGKITFSVSLTNRTDAKVTLRFAVNDTGCGISEEALEHIFEPFVQQEDAVRSSFGGSGLGLAISKNLVDLMGGTIRVRSIVDIGSEFTVEVPLDIDPAFQTKRKENCSFINLHTLVVDDDLLVCEQTGHILRDIGMIAEWVTSGSEAIDRVNDRWNHQKDYDFILIDWKMPDMDGIETSRQIRRIVGPDVTIIIMTAYDWAAIENEAKAAGVNMCINKPMLRSTLVSAFTKATDVAEQSHRAQEESEIDFEGRRILLAEDHPLNAEIAARLLNGKHAKVDVVENGLKAMERFATEPVGHYDAILMDVRMPVMDGLQAATNIRHWDKEDARTIPIVAMTANAFDEDVEKSKAAGMDAHLAKPIDPEFLYRVLFRLMK